MKVPGSESSIYGTFIPGSESTWERKFHNFFLGVGKMRLVHLMHLVRLLLVRLSRRVFWVLIVRLTVAAKMHLDGYNASTQFASCQAYKPYKQLAWHCLSLHVWR